MLPVAALFADNGQPERVDGCCRRPGIETTQIAARMGNAAAFSPMNSSASRVKVLHANISRCGISNYARSDPLRRPGFWARPCPKPSMPSCLTPLLGEGVVRKDADALKNWSPESNFDIAATQRELIDSAFHALRPGGTLVYSTCTLNREENQSVIEWLLSRYPQAVEILPLGELFPGAADALTAEGFLHVFPQIYDCEGFFVARLRKTAAIDPLPAPGYKVGKFPFTPLKDREAAAVTAAARAVGLGGTQAIRCGSGIKSCGCFRWLWSPCSARCAFLASACAWRSCTIRYRWQHEAVIAFAAPQRAFELSQEEAEEWYRGRNVYPQTAPGQDGNPDLQGVPLGLAKRVGSPTEEQLSARELVRDGKLLPARCEAAQKCALFDWRFSPH